MPKTKNQPSSPPNAPFRLRRSRVHGKGLFATRAIKKGAPIIEYIGERISHAEADRRHSKKDEDDGHTFLFTVDAKTVIDAGVGGNVARYINHSCDGNCEVIIDEGRLFVESIRAIAPGEELAYDYNIGRSPDDPPNVDQIFACRCGAPNCRGTMMEPRKKPAKAKPKAKAKAKAKTKTKKKATTKKKVARKPKTAAAPARRGATRRAA
ncbi:MAG TPA: SET domain-containing protein-lysine N-methyltransferase [Gaiellaceae bacterium]|nr:SET domain-containing protein-lysine N-methyltransferase [Gaiellaceae bacterium]